MSCTCCDDKAPTFEPFIDSYSLDRHCPLDNQKKRFKLAVGTPQCGSVLKSRLQDLPIELYHNCLQYLDIGTITTLRRVSQTTRSAIDSLFQYQELYEHAPNALRACLRTGIAPHIPLLRLHRALTTMECHFCKTSETPSIKFSSYLSLHTGYRTCLFCIRNNPLLKSTEFKSIMPLCTNPRTSIQMTHLPTLRTIIGVYNTPLESRHRPPPPATLVLCSAIQTKPGRSFLDQERKVIFGNEDIPAVAHHPLVKACNESNINPAKDYLGPETSKQITYRYASVISFPYVLPSKSGREYGIFCKECVLMMRYLEDQWTESQRTNFGHFGHLPLANDQTVARITKARELACRQYLVSEEAQNEVAKLDEERRMMSLAEHRKTHVAVENTVSADWKAWCKKLKGPPLPLFHHNRFG
ncbi:hypothetical protein BKA65DRAFT_157505 [Rhexocercosporidium sp. MPI-PUGE-AT-0058]|nr:hypothetical protein BKA65DRAFT_157505 [Rhexocercosporidium sp. MPI-PUGE-AT-0058]